MDSRVLEGREFFCVRNGIASRRFTQTRGVPQGAVLSPLLFSILLSGIPYHADVNTYVYADDIAFFASADDIQSLYRKLQAYLNTLEQWLAGLHLYLNVNKSAVLVFPLGSPVYLTLCYQNKFIPQVEQTKYLGVIYDSKLNWLPHIEHVAKKGGRALGILRRLSNNRSGMRRDTLLMIYSMYVRPILEFGCALFSGSAAYKIRPLVLIERDALRLCLGLPKFVSNAVLYLEARVPSLMARFRLLTVQTFLRLLESPFRRHQTVFISQPTLFFNVHWPRFNTPQVVFAQTLLEPLNVKLYEITPAKSTTVTLEIIFDNIYPNNAKHLSSQILNALLEDHLCHIHTNAIIATDASQNNEKAGVGIFLTRWIGLIQLDFLILLLSTQQNS